MGLTVALITIPQDEGKDGLILPTPRPEEVEDKEKESATNSSALEGADLVALASIDTWEEHPGQRSGSPTVPLQVQTGP